MAEIPHFKLAHHHGTTGDWVPDYAAVATQTITASGNWSTLGLVPSANDVVLIAPGATVTFDSSQVPPFKALAVKGAFVFSATRNSHLQVGTVQVYDGGLLEARHISPQAGTTRISFTGPLNTEEDPEEMSLGLFSVGGTVTLEGKAKNPFTACVSAPAGATTVSVVDATGWRVGDTLLFADTQTNVDVSHWSYTLNRSYLVQQFERRNIVQINLTTSPHTVVLNAPLGFSHTGWVANETRSITLTTAIGNAQRGHVLFGGHSKVCIKNTTFYGLGRTTTGLLNSTYRNSAGAVVGPTVVVDDQNDPIPNVPHNQIGRYPLHAHHLHEPVLFDGNVVTGPEANVAGRGRYIVGALKWGIALHGSHGHLVRNVVVGAEGVGIITEAGNETGLIEDNLVIGTGGGESFDSIAAANTSETVAALNLVVNQGGAVWGKSSLGVGYWFRGPFLVVRRNRAAGYFHAAAFEIWVHGKTVTIPAISRVDSTGNPVFGLPDDGLSGTTQFTNEGTIVFEDNTSQAISPEELGISYTHGEPVILRFQAQHRGAGNAVFLGWSKTMTFKDCVLKGEGSGTAIYRNATTDPPTLTNCTITGFAN